MEKKETDRIFNEALELASSVERAAFLRGVCGDEWELLRKVERLLLAHEEAGGFMATEPRSRRGEVPLFKAPGTMIAAECS